jgi:hypothetical protein
MDVVRNISDNPESNTAEESASTKATKTVVDTLVAEATAREEADGALSTRIDNIFRSSSEEENFFSYGIQFDTTISAPAVSRIGNASLHRELPIQSAMKACLLLDNGTVNYYLNPLDWTKKIDGTASNLNGTDGQVMIELPSFYIKFKTDGNVNSVKISPYNLSGFTYVPKFYIAAFEASLQRSNSKLASVVNGTTDFRGGNNNATYDGSVKSFLGRPVTDVSRTNFRTYARNRGSENWNVITYDAYKALFWLYYIEYANLNSQAAVNLALDGNGFRQGGLGNGVTEAASDEWSTFNGYYPFVPCGTSNILTSKTGEISYIATDFGGAGVNRTFKVNRYRGIENPFGHIWKWVDGVNIKIQAVDAGNLSQLFVCSNPANFQDVNYANYDLRGNLVRTEGYIKEVLMGNFGDIMPALVGGGSTTWWSDYSYTNIPASGEVLGGVVFGGTAASGARAGFGCSATAYAPSNTATYIGSRLCFLGS